MSNITQVVKHEKNMTTLSRGVTASGLDQVLSGTGPFTLFAPSDLAFAKLQTGAIESLLQPDNKVKLTSLMNQHIVAGKINFTELKDGDTLKNLDGKELSVKVINNTVTIDGATIQNRDVPSSNGVIHSLDAVLKN